MTDYQRLRELAEQATPGPWTLEYDSDSGEYGENYGQWPHALNGPKSQTEWSDPEWQEQYGHHVSEISDMSDADAEFIAAANPSTVLALLDARDALVQQVANQAEEIALLRRGQGRAPAPAAAGPVPVALHEAHPIPDSTRKD